MLKTICQQEAIRCNTQGGVMMKATPAPSLVVAQAELLLKLLIVSFSSGWLPWELNWCRAHR